MQLGKLVIYDNNFIRNTDIPGYNYGVLLHIDEEGFICTVMNIYGTFSTVPTEYVYEIDTVDNKILEIQECYQEEIKAKSELLRSVRRSDYEDEVIDKYELLKVEIINTCKNLIDSESDVDFENKLKAICEKKKQIFSIECEGVNDARKYNGQIKYEIKELERRMDRDIKNLKNIDAFVRKIPYNILPQEGDFNG